MVEQAQRPPPREDSEVPLLGRFLSAPAASPAPGQGLTVFLGVRGVEDPQQTFSSPEAHPALSFVHPEDADSDAPDQERFCASAPWPLGRDRRSALSGL